MVNSSNPSTFQRTTKSVLFGLLFLLTAQSLTACLPLMLGTATITSINLHLDRRTIGRNIDDNTLELKLRRDFRADDQLGKVVNLSITTINGIVLLTGEVPTDDQRQHAQKIAESYTETRKVVNEIELAGKTTLHSRVNDSYLTSKVKLKLLNAENVPSANIKVITERGRVYLLGLVTADEAEAAVKIAQSVQGVAHIVKVFEYIDP